ERDERAMTKAFHDWAFYKKGEAIGRMDGQQAALEGFIAGADWQARAALERKPAGSADLAAFNAAFQKAMETGWDDPIDLALQLWNARGALERKPSTLVDQLQADLTARDERMDRAEQVLRKVAKLRGALEQHGLLEEVE